jgi:hypothetical protein
MSPCEPLKPRGSWERLARSVEAAADQLEGFLVALQSGDAARARRHLDASRDERARGHRLQAEADAEPGLDEQAAPPSVARSGYLSPRPSSGVRRTRCFRRAPPNKVSWTDPSAGSATSQKRRALSSCRGARYVCGRP